MTSKSNDGSLWNKIGNFFKAKTTTQKPKAKTFDSQEAVKYSRVIFSLQFLAEKIHPAKNEKKVKFDA